MQDKKNIKVKGAAKGTPTVKKYRTIPFVVCSTPLEQIRSALT
jgi:hypothetical protein